jgi:DNA-binding CsgD family transcriptional regulator
MLVGRQQESARLERLLAAARSGTSRVVVIEGEPGIGKTALLEHARRRARGLTVLETSGHELEAELPFAGLSRLVAPILELRARLADPQRRALEGALALRTVERLDRFAVYAAVLQLMAAAAEERPAVAIVDDAQWLDRSTAEALGFVARRLDAEPVALLVGTRENEAGFAPSAEHLRLGGIGPADARALLERLGMAISPDAARQLVEGTGGNPLAITQVALQLSPAQRRGREPLPDPLPAVSSAAAIFGPRLERLGDEARVALTVVAASGSGALSEVSPALAVLNVPPEALDAGAESRLIALDDVSARFCHPLARSLAYHAAPTARRRAAHRALADVTDGTGPPGRSTWHRAAAMLGPDDSVAGELTRVAADARARGAPVAAARALERAAQLTPGAETAARRLLAAAQEFHLGGHPERAVQAIEAALELTADDGLRADGQRLRAGVDTLRRPPDEVRRELLAAIERIDRHDPSRAAQMRVDAAWLALFAARLSEALDLARRAYPVCQAIGGLAALQATLTLCAVLELTGAGEEGDRLLPGAEPILHRDDALLAPHMVATVAHGYLLTGRIAEASTALRDLVARCRAAGVIGALPFALASLADIAFHAGEWDRAYAAASESVALAEDVGQHAHLGHSLLRLAQVEGGQGRERDCRSHLERLRRIAGADGTDSLLAMAAWVEGMLELGLGHFAEAVPPLEFAGSLCEARGHREPFIVPWAPDLIEAYARLERIGAARAVLELLERYAAATDRPLNHAYAGRCQALLAPDDEAEDHFEAALAWHREGSAAPFQEARTALCRGERLRRAGRRVDARRWLVEAETTFERLGGRGWLERARTELAATGQRARRRQPSTSGELTPQELQVALEVADGATNREVAARLFLSTKTVEAHLSRAYRKLGVRSRSELTARLLRQPPPATRR